MLKRLSPVLSPELLSTIRAMGHFHEIAIVDANFPCDLSGPTIIRADGVSATDILDAVLFLMPLEKKAPAAWRMIVEGNPETNLPIFDEFREIMVRQDGEGHDLEAVNPDDFKARVRNAYAVVITGERRLYGSLIVRKGVVPPT